MIKIFRLKLYSKEVKRKKKKTKTMISALGHYESLINLNHRLNTKDYKQIKVFATFNIMGKENFQVQETIRLSKVNFTKNHKKRIKSIRS